MRVSLYSLLLVCIGLYSCTDSTDQSNDLFVKVSNGYLEGEYNSDSSVVVFKGIPYAAPPVNELRWRAPQPLSDWYDTLKCQDFPPSPIQNKPVPFSMWSEEFITPAEPLSEDCLYLNIWAPSGQSSAQSIADKPVFVWIHGGAFVSGSGACPIYDGEEFAKQGIVFVSINYRLGVFGFMAHPQLSLESTINSSGNYGLMDQIVALRWVKQNINKWGGDSTQVTIAGQSAGGSSVEALIFSPLAKGFFNQAIVQSGSLLSKKMDHLKHAEENGLKISKIADYKNITQLRELSADSLLVVANRLPFGFFQPIIDKYIIPRDPNKMLSEGNFNDVTMMSGWVTGDSEISSFKAKDKEGFMEYVRESHSDSEVDFYKLFPADNDSLLVKSQNKLALLEFKIKADFNLASKLENDIYLYEYDYVPTDKPGFPNYGAFHTS
ncbi:MAG: carboxylesterase family protein [Cyclobacteriaceae bacterium]|nr:carboxylesterase family protein [Cyclobacteriaceae bacterium]